jgi:formylglycine-generating enzyme
LGEKLYLTDKFLFIHTPMKTKSVALNLLLLVSASVLSATVTVDTRLVNNTGNAADFNGLGSVNHIYRIGTYSITNAQYTAFLNATAATDTHGTYLTQMASINGIQRLGSPGSYSYNVSPGFENRPVTVVNFWSAARFVNWLTNGQPVGAQDLSTTESGSYFLNGVTNPLNESVTRTAGWESMEGAFFLPSLNEWYKAAYYDPTKNSTGGYWSYATRSDTAPISSGPTSAPNSANYNDAVGNPVDVGSYSGSASYYGTYDQAGNVWEWTDTVVLSGRPIRGGAFNSVESDLSSLGGVDINPQIPGQDGGFRIVMITAIPEPSTVSVLMGLSVLCVIAVSRLRRRTR